MSDKIRAFLLLDYFREILPAEDEDGNPVKRDADIDLAQHVLGIQNQRRECISVSKPGPHC